MQVSQSSACWCTCHKFVHISETCHQAGLGPPPTAGPSHVNHTRSDRQWRLTVQLRCLYIQILYLLLIYIQISRFKSYLAYIQISRSRSHLIAIHLESRSQSALFVGLPIDTAGQMDSGDLQCSLDAQIYILAQMLISRSYLLLRSISYAYKCL